MLKNCTYERSDDDAHDERNNVTPDRQSDVLFDHHDETQNEAGDKYDDIPPPRCLLVVLVHVCVVRVIEFTSLGRFESSDCVATPKEDNVSNQSTDLCHVRMQ
jgi:hypothetical protein